MHTTGCKGTSQGVAECCRQPGSMAPLTTNWSAERSLCTWQVGLAETPRLCAYASPRERLMARPGAVICELNTRCGPTRRPALLLSCITLPPAFSIRLASCHARFALSDVVLAGLHPLAA